jgi:hypothetical protein
MLCKRLQLHPLPGELCKIFLTPKVFTLIDPEDFETVSRFHWRLRKSSHCFYVAAKIRRNGKTWYMKLHRLIALTSAEQDCHHINHNTLDNRRANLQNLSKIDHALAHQGLSVK